MNEEELRTRLEAAVSDVRPHDRFDELMARRPSHRNRGRIVVGIAAALLAVLATALVVRHGSSPQSVITVDPTETTTTTPGGGDRIGTEITIAESALPAGLHLLDELPRRSGADQTIVARYAEDDRLWNGDGPYVRIVVDRGTGIGTTWQEANRGQPDYQVSGEAAYLSTDTTTDPQITSPPGNLSGLSNAWVTLEWSTGPDELVRVQAKGLDIETVRAIADSVVIVS